MKKQNIIATIEEIKALNQVHMFMYQLKKGEINLLVKDSADKLYNSYKQVYDRFTIMNKYICDWHELMEHDKKMKRQTPRFQVERNMNDIEMSLQILMLNDIIDKKTYKEMLKEVKKYAKK